jgi:hypothetical protein
MISLTPKVSRYPAGNSSRKFCIACPVDALASDWRA